MPGKASGLEDALWEGFQLPWGVGWEGGAWELRRPGMPEFWCFPQSVCCVYSPEALNGSSRTLFRVLFAFSGRCRLGRTGQDGLIHSVEPNGHSFYFRNTKLCGSQWLRASQGSAHPDITETREGSGSPHRNFLPYSVIGVPSKASALRGTCVLLTFLFHFACFAGISAALRWKCRAAPGHVTRGEAAVPGGRGRR